MYSLEWVLRNGCTTCTPCGFMHRGDSLLLHRYSVSGPESPHWLLMPYLSEHSDDVKYTLLHVRPLNSAQLEHPYKVALLLSLREVENNDQPLTLKSSQLKMGDRQEDQLLR